MARPLGNGFSPSTVLALCAATALSACASEPQVGARSAIAPDSPLAAAIAQARSQPLPYPKWTDIPKAPADLRTAESWSQAQGELQGAADEIAQLNASAPEIADAQAYGAQLLAQSGLNAVQAPDAGEAARIEAYARELRERATPPPPPR